MLLGALLLLASPAVHPQDAAPSDEPAVVLLQDRCVRCHGGRRTRAGLDLTTRAGVLAGGDSGEQAAWLEAPGDSPLIARVSSADEDVRMPPAGEALTSEEVELLTAWIADGMPGIPEGEVEPPDPMEGWAYGPPKRPAVPAVADPSRVANPIDAFVLARLDEAGLAPNPPADRRALIRRVTYDLTGLPPTPEEVDAFLADARPGAWGRLVDRLLASPHYGERWGRHWLDVVRYAETNGYERDTDKPEIWRYRDWVVDAFNADLPYDRFVLEQLAGDELPDADGSSRTATGYYRLMQWDDEPGQGRLQARYDVLDDVVRTTSEAFLATTLGCARCHDHKGDPVTQVDYSSFVAFFHGVTDMSVDGFLEEVPRPAIGAAAPASVRTAVVQETLPIPQLHVHERGSVEAQGDPVEPRFPVVLDADAPEIAAPAHGRSSGRRLALARWIASPDNPLTARVMANRVWHHHFGRGLCPSTSDFGNLGARPTHPLLLDWLAAELVDGDWSLKALHRTILLSSTYRTASTGRADALEQDPTNRLLWRFEPRRLSGEEVRDTVLALTGRIVPRVGGPSFFSRIPRDVLATSSRPDQVWGRSSDEETYRRSVYIKVKRSLLTPILTSFDLADTDSACPERFRTTTPLQALGLLNGDFAHRHARGFAARLRAEHPGDPRAQVARAIRLAFGRGPEEEEIEDHVALLDDLQRDFGLDAEAALDELCLVLLNLNELLYLD